MGTVEKPGRRASLAERTEPNRIAALSCDEPPFVHPTALVEPEVEVGAGTAIWDSVHLRGPATIGRHCIIGEKTYIAYGVSIGNLVKINAQVYICTGVRIENRVMVAAGVVFTNDRYPRAFGDADDRLAFSGPTEDTLATIVRQGATLGARAVIGPGLEVGEFAMVGMGAVVVVDVPPHALVYGSPARVHGYVCICGTPLPDVDRMGSRRDNGICNRCRRTYTVSRSADGRPSFTFQRHLGGVAPLPLNPRSDVA